MAVLCPPQNTNENPQPEYLDAFDSKAEVGSRADAFAPLHIARLEDRLDSVLLWRWGARIHTDHLVVEILRKTGDKAGLQFNESAIQVSCEEYLLT